MLVEWEDRPVSEVLVHGNEDSTLIDRELQNLRIVRCLLTGFARASNIVPL